ncbi:MAG: hypothetical protein OXG82_13515 [Gammaproteobacteria bacterium]|nr:hypothetical protein [Gammaproteobacteria bacterium]
MTTPRRLLVDPVNACDYHLVSRCVQQAFLFGRDPATGRDGSHRKQWLVDRLNLLACCFAVQIYAYCIMSNHFHLVARYDPLACWRWSDEEVARRWVDAFPPKAKGEVVEERKAEARELLLANPARLLRARRTLGSLGDFMKHLLQPIARRANLENGTSGHAWGGRYYSGALLSEEALLAAMAYVDLNPVRAGIAGRIEQCRHTSIAERVVENSAEALRAYLAPVMSGLDERGPQAAEDPSATAPEAAEHARPAPALPRPGITVREYVAMVRAMADAVAAPAAKHPNRVRGWLARLAVLGRRQRAYGPEEELASWIGRRGLQMRETPLPA